MMLHANTLTPVGFPACTKMEMTLLRLYNTLITTGKLAKTKKAIPIIIGLLSSAIAIGTSN